MRSEELTWRIPYSRPEKVFVPASPLPSTSCLSDGPEVREFEWSCADFLGARYAIATCSGTIALYCLYRALGFAGGTIIMPAYTWRSTAEAAVMASAKPFFVDIDPETFLISQREIELALVAVPDAYLVGVDIFGLPVSPPPLGRIAVDAAHSFGATVARKKMRYQIPRAYSFSSTKNLITNEGGLIATDDLEITEKCRGIRRWAGRMTEYNAACGLAGLKRLPEILSRKREIAEEYREGLREMGLQVQEIPQGFETTWKDVIVLFDSQQERNTVKIGFEAAGIETRIYFTPVYEYLEPEQYLVGRLPVTRDIFSRSLCLPSWPGAPVKGILKEIKECLGSKCLTKSVIA